MIWILLFICIYGTMFCIRQLFDIISSRINTATIAQTIDILTEQERVSDDKILTYIYSKKGMKRIEDIEQKTFAIGSIILSIMWTLFFYLSN